MLKALDENKDAMFAVALGESHQHAFVKGIRKGLQEALDMFRKDFQLDRDSF